jgi:hypothetical protein
MSEILSKFRCKYNWAWVGLGLHVGLGLGLILKPQRRAGPSLQETQFKPSSGRACRSGMGFWQFEPDSGLISKPEGRVGLGPRNFRSAFSGLTQTRPNLRNAQV